MSGTPKYLGDHAELTPDKPAAINSTSGEILTYRELDDRSNRFAQCLYAAGLRRGDHIAMVLENNMRCFEVCWAALRSGLVITPVNRFMTAAEAAGIIEDSNAQVVISSHAMRELAAELTSTMPTCRMRLMMDDTIAGWDSYEALTHRYPAKRLADEWLGATMIYSSGTTGRPKGIIRAQPQGRVTEGSGSARRPQFARYGFDAHTVYLSPAPLYHTAPLGYGLETQFGGGTVVFMEKFEPLDALRAIERYRVTHSQWVPTMLIRLLKLDPAVRNAFDLSSHRVAIHAAAPCPQEIKRQMIDWWGPIIEEYYSSTEGNGVTTLNTEEWLAHPGSVGRALLGIIHICDDEGNELPVGESGLVYFERDQLPFHYHNDPDKTRAAQHSRHPAWTAVGDIGRVDSDGYLYLTDRKAFMIISGGVNIYPQAIEDALAVHPDVHDAAVIGVPDAEMGEQVKAIVEPAPGVAPSEALAERLLDYLRTRVARYMVPRSIDFIDAMPRLPTGKLYKQALRERYGVPATRSPV
ncbi:acyl-CoA synthetase [Paraburkholderia gardini]|uniref:acyl-CoA synthetase n=1 Tax=Paraburkholderia gardini TaxID=2823469 RepID=UPI001D8F90E0|nr:acyl-CoA synthetase [Paraburkholderia gardini]CAG4894087.1 Long-chain-fatty-acid--CoA ligase [Paraburkholderia gardini]